jgi:hypothetical protein
MIPSQLVTQLATAITQYAYADIVSIWRATNAADGIGGVTQGWLQVAEIRGTLSSNTDSQGVVGGVIEIGSTWTLTCAPGLPVQADDRVYYTSGTPQSLADYFEVVGGDAGHTNAITQTVSLRYRTNG